MTYTLSFSSEMMTNYLQAELIAPQKKFEALQAADGSAALFAIDSSGVLHAILEQSGSSVAGWTVTDLSSAQIARDFPGVAATVSTFEVGQSVADGTCGLAMVVTSGSTNRLYLSLGNSTRDLSWTSSPSWTSYPYDGLVSLSTLEIVGVYFCEPVGTTQYVLVDVARDPSSTVQDILRFLIDPTKASGRVWNSHDVPIDVEVGGYASVTGRQRGGFIDGVYTAGTAGTSGQLAFLPIENVFGDGPPLPARLDLPTGAVPTAIASSRNLDLSTDLFVISGSSLFYFASSNQADGAKPATLLDDDMFSGTTRLVAMVQNGSVTLWGRNGSDQVWSTSCPAGSVATPSAWGVPLPLLSGMEQMSAYVNAVDGGNTIFAAGTGSVERITRDSENGVWVTDQITLPAPTQQPAISFNSYTTTIQVTGDDGLPAAQATLALSASRRAGVYVNGTYYVVDAVPVHVTTTTSGTVTIVEATGTLTGTTFTVSAGTGTGVTINPMAGPFQKLAQLNTPTALTAAEVTNPDGTTRPLVPAGAPAGTVGVVASSLSQLATCYDQVTAPASPRALAATAVAAPNATSGAEAGGPIDVALGDLFQWLESEIEAVVKIVEDAAAGVWRFVAEIGSAIYQAVIDSAEAVVGAAVWLFDQVKTGIDDLIGYVGFLFEWDDIRRTKDVFHNLVRQYLAGGVTQLATAKTEFDSVMGSVEQTVATWAGLSDWSALGESAGKPATGSAVNPMGGQTAASQHLNHHFQNNASSISVIGDLPVPDVLQDLIDDLLTALKDEATVLDGVLDELHQLATDFASLSVEHVLTRLAGILADGVLGSAQVVVDAVLAILIAVAESALALLDTKIHIPVISDILAAIGVPEFSFLDLFCWIAAVAYTVVYKIAEGQAPFPDTATTAFLSTSSLSQLEQAFGGGGGQPTPMLAAARATSGSGLVQIPESVAEAVYVAGHSLGGFFALMSDFVSTFEAAQESGDNPFGIPSAVVGAISGASVGITNVLAPRDPIQNTYVSKAGTATTAVRLLAKAVFSGPGQKKFKASTTIMRNLAVEDGRATGAIVDSILVIPALACSAWHFYEIAEQSDGTARTDAILEEVSNLTSYISRVSYAVAVNDEDPDSRAILIGVMAAANLATAGLQTAEAIVG